MLTQICTLKFADGHVITATVTAASPTGNETITYTGDTNRLATGLKPTASPANLRARLSNLAEDLGAEYSEEQIGNYDIWAE